MALALSLTVVRIGLPRMMPSRPMALIGRATVQPGHIEALALQLPPDLADPRRPGSSPQTRTGPPPLLRAASRLVTRQTDAVRIDALCDMGVIGRRGDRQHPADRLDPVRLAVIVDRGNHGLNRRSSSAWAKCKRSPCAIRSRWPAHEARGSRVPEPSALSPHPVGTPARTPLSRSAFFTHSCSVCAVQLDLGGDRRETATAPSARSMLAFVIQNHSHRAGADASEERTCWSSCLSWLHLLRSWSLRSTRSGSSLHSHRAKLMTFISRVLAPRML